MFRSSAEISGVVDLGGSDAAAGTTTWMFEVSGPCIEEQTVAEDEKCFCEVGSVSVVSIGPWASCGRARFSSADFWSSCAVVWISCARVELSGAGE